MMAANVKMLQYIGHQKGHITKAKEHVKYMTAPREHHRNNPNLFDESRDYVNRREFFDRLENQRPSPRHAFMHKMVILLSEEERNRLQINLKELARDTMSRFEGKTGHRIDWVGAIHDDKGHPHCHLAFRGRDQDGKPIFIGKEQIRELRKIVDEEKVRQAERNLGVEKAQEINRELQQKAEKHREQGGLGQDIVQSLSAGFMRMLADAEYEREQARRRADREAQRKARKKRKQRGIER